MRTIQTSWRNKDANQSASPTKTRVRAQCGSCAADLVMRGTLPRWVSSARKAARECVTWVASQPGPDVRRARARRSSARDRLLASFPIRERRCCLPCPPVPLEGKKPVLLRPSNRQRDTGVVVRPEALKSHAGRQRAGLEMPRPHERGEPRRRKAFCPVCNRIPQEKTACAGKSGSQRDAVLAHARTETDSLEEPTQSIETHLVHAEGAATASQLHCHPTTERVAGDMCAIETGTVHRRLDGIDEHINRRGPLRQRVRTRLANMSRSQHVEVRS